MARGYAYPKVWVGGWDDEHDERCPSNFSGSCDGWIWHSNRVARTWRGKQTRARCAKACGDKIQYASGIGGNPCQGADYIRQINPSENLHTGASAAFECTWNNITDGTLRNMSNDNKYTNSGVYDQLLFGTRVGGYNTEGKGYCEDVNNLHKDVGGGTCYDKLAAKVSGETLKQKAIQYCESHRTDPKCKCINVSGSGFAERCKQNPIWAGCDEINEGAAKYESVGVLQAITGLAGGADCLVPGICSGDVYEPQTAVPACANQIGICDQVQNINVGKLDEAAELEAFQSCNIEFQAAKDAAGSSSGSPSGIPSNITYPPGSVAEKLDTDFRSKLPQFVQPFVPVTIDELKTDRNKQIGVGGTVGSIFSFVLVILLVLILATSGGSGRPLRFRRR
jgi:hypothetical protein